MNRALRCAFIGLGLLLAPGSATAQTSACEVTWPKDLKAPQLTETFPLKGVAGHVYFLDVKVKHLPGERIFPAGVDLAADDEGKEALKKAEFRFPASASKVKPIVQPGEAKGKDKGVVTQVALPFIPLPAKAGRKELTLPRIPITVARASGQVHTLCTQPHIITVEDPLASEAQPKAKPDPEPRPQIEVWTALRDAVLAMLFALPIALVLAWLFIRYRDRFKKAPKPPPPRPPWETAFERLDAIERKKLLEQHDYEEYLDGVSDALREYLGERYGFDGLESTTRETLRQLSALASDFDEDRAVRTILQRADLVKFARRLPSEEECQDAMAETRRLVRKTIIAPSLDPRGQASREDSRG